MYTKVQPIAEQTPQFQLLCNSKQLLEEYSTVSVPKIFIISVPPENENFRIKNLLIKQTFATLKLFCCQ